MPLRRLDPLIYRITLNLPSRVRNVFKSRAEFVPHEGTRGYWPTQTSPYSGPEYALASMPPPRSSRSPAFAHLKKPAHAFAIYSHTRSLTDGATSGKSTPRTGRTKSTSTVTLLAVRGRCCAPREECQEKVRERGTTAVTPTAVTKVRAPLQTRSRDSVSEMQSDGGKRGKHNYSGTSWWLTNSASSAPPMPSSLPRAA